MTIVSGNSGRTYDVDLAKNFCSCPGWRFQRGLSANDRTCKHLEQIKAELRKAQASGRTLAGRTQ